MEEGTLVSLNTMIFYVKLMKKKDIFRIGIIATLDFSIFRSQKGLI